MMMMMNTDVDVCPLACVQSNVFSHFVALWTVSFNPGFSFLSFTWCLTVYCICLPVCLSVCLSLYIVFCLCGE